MKVSICYFFFKLCGFLFVFLTALRASGAIGFDDFSGYNPGTGLADLPYEVLSGTFTQVEILEDAASLSGQVLRLRHSSSRASLSRNGVDLDGRGEVLILARPNSGAQKRYTPPGTMMSEGENGYRYRYLDFSSGGWGTRLDYYVNGSLNNIGSRQDWPGGPEGASPVWIRHRILGGGQHAVKIWTKGDPEPEAWRQTATNSAHTAGRIGFFLTDPNLDFEVEYFSWSENPDAHPAPAPWDDEEEDDEEPVEPDGIFEYETLVNSYGDGSLTNGGYSFQDRQPLASFKAPDGTLWQVVSYVSINRLPVVQWRKREPDTATWSLWARIGPSPDVLPATGANWHGYVSTAIDTAGYVRLMYDGRGDGEFRYHRSDLPIHQGWTGDLNNRSDAGLPGWNSNTNSTYWRFSKHPKTGMMTLSLRRSGGGHSLFVLDAETQIWSAFPGTRQSDGRLFANDGLFAHYVAHDVVFRGEDVFVGYSERQSGSATTNEDLSVVKYNGETEAWMKLDGTVLTTPIGRGQGTVIDPSKTGSMLDHRWDMMADGQGRVHGFYRRLDDNDRLQIFHFWIDREDNVHGPEPVTDFTDYTDFWQNIGSNATLSQARSFYLDDTVYLAWQERNHGQRTRAMAARYPFTTWSEPREIDDIDLRTSDPEFERWAWDSRGEIWLTAMPFATNSGPEGRPVTVRHIKPELLPALAAMPFDDWIPGTGVPPERREPTDRNGPLQISNLEAYALGIDPMKVSKEDLIRLDTVMDGQARVRFTRNLLAMNLDLDFEFSNDLVGWLPLEADLIQVLGQQHHRETIEAVFTPDGPKPWFLRFIHRLQQ
ncbi:MAG: BNR-4 repeat-containing protein [Verrucomicrobia bacterium]|nr:BNR-4 repeat-containing protein [Verrucomicrobiota bacterium]MCH8513493.1 BNR repeat-containing protein [Kiritimatiellia bacterium]